MSGKVIIESNDTEHRPTTAQTHDVPASDTGRNLKYLTSCEDKDPLMFAKSVLIHWKSVQRFDRLITSHSVEARSGYNRSPETQLVRGAQSVASGVSTTESGSGYRAAGLYSELEFTSSSVWSPGQE
jgi:hypothetical protein